MSMSLKTKIGQKLCVGFTGTTVTPELEDAIRRYHFGNIILFRRNFVDEAQGKALCRDLDRLIFQHTGIRPFIAIDQEGGMVTRLPDDSLNIPGAMALAAHGDAGTIRHMNEINGRILLDYGINLNLAPVADVNCEADNPVIGVRSYGDDPAAVARLAREAYEGLERAGIMSAAKHFPGHGATRVDTHLDLPALDQPGEVLEARELRPFKALIEAGIPAVMTAHILFPGLGETHYPATMSRLILQDILRGELGFRGLILSDCLEMKAIADHFGTAEGVRRVFEAGVDLAFVSHTLEEAGRAHELVAAAWEEGALDRAALEESVERILRAKARYVQGPRPLEAAERDGFRREISELVPATFVPLGESGAIRRFAQDPQTVVLGPPPHRATNVSNQESEGLSFARELGTALDLPYIETKPEPSAAAIEGVLRQLEAMDGVRQVILGTYNAHVTEGQLALWRALRRLPHQRLIVSLRNPYDLMYLAEDELGIATFEYTHKSLSALARILKSGAELPATMPVSLPRRTL